MKNPFRIVQKLGIVLCILSLGIAGYAEVKPLGQSEKIISRSAVGETPKGGLQVAAVGRGPVNRSIPRVGGVLFQATASPGDSIPKSVPIQLSHQVKNDHDAALYVHIGTQKYLLDTPAWVWCIAAKVTDSEYTGLVSLYGEQFGKPATDDEKKFAELHKIRNWIVYHPDVEDTLVGVFLLGADSVFLRGETFLNFLNMPNGEFVPGYGSHKIDKRKQGIGLMFVDLLMQENTTYILNDVDSSFQFDIKNEMLEIEGVPNFEFAITFGDFFVKKDESAAKTLRRHRTILYDINPTIFHVVDDFAKATAFFRYVKKENPEEFSRFMKSLDHVIKIIPTAETPVVIKW